MFNLFENINKERMEVLCLLKEYRLSHSDTTLVIFVMEISCLYYYLLIFFDKCEPLFWLNIFFKEALYYGCK